jgi:hypothetical protein
MSVSGRPQSALDDATARRMIAAAIGRTLRVME